MDTAEISTPQGKIRISDAALAALARAEALHVPGVAGMDSSLVQGISSMMGFPENTEGVRVSIKDQCVALSLYIKVCHGIRIPDLALKLQERVKAFVESMTGLSVSAVNIYVQGVVFEES